MQKCEMHETHSNNMFYQPRYVPINISNLFIILVYGYQASHILTRLYVERSTTS